MPKKGKKPENLGQHIGSAIFANLLAGFISAGAFFLIVKLYGKPTSDQPTYKLFASVAVLTLWCISYGLIVISLRHGEPFKKNLKYIGYYFPLTTLFVWAFNQRSLRCRAEEKLRRLEKIVEGWPDVRIIAGIIDSDKQKETLNRIIDDIDNMKDHLLAQILDNIRRNSDDILGSVGVNGNYDLFRQVMEKVSLSEPSSRPETCTCLLWLLSEVFRMPPKGCFTRQIQKDMLGPLKHAIWRVDPSHLNRMGTIIEQIMSDEEDEQDIARQILEFFLHFPCSKMKQVWQIMFNESEKRALRFQQSFGFDFLTALRQLEHKVFWLDIQSLRILLEDGVEKGDRGLIKLKQKAYDELCSTVFAPLENEEYAGIHNCRVFRRLKKKGGRVEVKCNLPNGDVCTCEGKSLGFRGLYSKKCHREEGAKMKAKVITIVEVGQTKPKQEFTLSASVAKLHPDEARKQSKGRGIFFEDGEDKVVKDLYEYVSSSNE